MTLVTEDDGRPKDPLPLDDDERRVLGVLIEKSLTTPDAYPMTLNGLVNGCSQKSNRSPVLSYDEGRVDETLERLREKQLVNEVHTAGGRTEKFRHVSRIRFGWNEVQVAVMGELLLRGRQQLGELRSRAARMRPVDSLEVLREALGSLQDAGFVRASGPLTRRGVEVDHALYDEASPAFDESDEPPPPSTDAVGSEHQPGVATSPGSPPQDEIAALRGQVRDLASEVAALRAEFAELRSLSER